MRLACLFVLLAVATAAGAQSRDRTLTVAPKEAVAGEARHALVIGNSAYTNGPLRNPVNDARAMAKALNETGFHVILVEDASQAAIQRAIRTFGNHIAKGGIGLFYYAGHGLQVKGRNYLVPVNADIAHEDEIEYNAVDVGQVLAKMDTAKNPLNIVILDACRNNPFQRSFRSAQAGLAQMDAPSGTFIAFATAPGSVAADGTGDNGVYTKHLLAEMVRPGVPLELMFRQVRNGVMSETKGRQTPWESSSLRGEFAFRPGAALSPVALVRPSEPASSLPARFPRQGNSWTYRLVERQRANPPRERRYTAMVTAVNEAVILERFSVEGGASGDWAHDGGKYLASLGRSLFSPYLAVFQELSPAARLDSIEIRDEACKARFLCEAEARVVGRETITVAAGTFDTVKVVVQHHWRPTVNRTHVETTGWAGTRELAIWYSPDVKRAVKFSNRLGPVFSSYRDHLAEMPDEGDFDLELVSYKLN